MEAFPTPREVSLRQRICKEAWQLSSLAAGKEKMKLISEAYPYAIDRSNAEGCIMVHWHPRLEAFMICDYGGFITMIPEGDTETLVSAVKMEFHQSGAFRESITGDKATPVKRREPKKFVRTQKKHLTLGDLGL